ncbi:MAG: hypothetical protein A2946_02085 [Candidatus Liptonbacteria bacterium RIFCSPLOWO2_01_FULL_53_13]|uniref:Methyltransferase FkbM domain-containing protein n=1 Tax=Candidatus Liptonbacteria bacterium RIFCSPLOWO2_01_FULL_53_13 TaxID=1798651 RepID=A0A1G2CMG4_9BACT|nr:MAG: hypothetical protein A2946_02085 [Candidatus Liptonbacteria bacterium RIFCSPLOWO2_01_FULL_53_13]
MTVKLMNGLEFKIHTGNSDINTLTEVFVADGYKEFFSLITPNSIAVDIGANYGAVSVAMARNGARVFAFKPNHYIAPLIGENASLNNVNISLYDIGIAGKSGFYPMNFEQGSWGGASIVFDALTAKKHEVFNIKCIALDEVFAHCKVPKIDFLKMDVEGVEYEILKSSDLRDIGTIFVEYHEPRVSKKEITALLQRKGFAVKDFENMSSLLARK